MVNIVKKANTGTVFDFLFTKVVNIIQSTVVKARVRKASNLHFERKGPRADEKFEPQLLAIGLRPDDLWWGPMTLFPRKAQFLIREVERLKPKNVLEVGSGTSTLLFAALAKKYKFKVFSLENHRNTVDYIRSVLSELSLGEEVTIHQCGFVVRQYPDGKKYRWYDADLSSIGEKFDFILVDGPMGKLVGRNGALPEILPYLAENHQIYLDDAQREHERQCIEEWRTYYPDIEIQMAKECFGIGLISFSASA